MNTYDFQNFYANKKEIRLTKRLKFHKKVKYCNKYDNLISNDLAEFLHYNFNESGAFVPVKDYICITEKGIAYLEYIKEKHRANLRSNIAILISLFALIIAALSFVLQYVQYKND